MSYIYIYGKGAMTGLARSLLTPPVACHDNQDPSLQGRRAWQCPHPVPSRVCWCSPAGTQVSRLQRTCGLSTLAFTLLGRKLDKSMQAGGTGTGVVAAMVLPCMCCGGSCWALDAWSLCFCPPSHPTVNANQTIQHPVGPLGLLGFSGHLTCTKMGSGFTSQTLALTPCFMMCAVCL